MKKKDVKKKSIKQKLLKFYRRYDTIVNIILCVIVGIGLFMLIKAYDMHIDMEVSKIEDGTDYTYTLEKYTINSNGFYTSNIEKDIKNYFDSNDTKTMTFKIKGESFYLNIVKEKDTDGKTDVYKVNKIIDTSRDIRARVSFKNIKEIEFRTGNNNNSTVIHLINDKSNVYYALIDDSYYTLGDDIESISYREDNHFYYIAYNKKYKVIDTVGTCDKNVQDTIDGFNFDDIYYNYGRINFLDDYYQKLSSESYTVKEKCDSLNDKATESKEVEE